MTEIAIAAGLALSACIAWSIGANDMANSTSIAVGSGVLRIKTAILIFAIMLTLGAVLQGFMVMKTLGRGVVSDMDIYCAISSSLAAFTWIMVATALGLPISTSHSITSAVVGAALGRLLLGRGGTINLHVFNTIVLSWITSPLAAAALAIPSYLVLEKLFKKRSSRGDGVARSVIIALTAFSAYSFGANDVANATGVYVGAISKYFGTPDLYTMRLLSLFSSVIIALGGIVMGRKVLVTLAYRITRLDILTAIAAGVANAFTVWFFTTIPYLLFGYGLPISTTYAAAGAIMGASIAKNRGFRGVRIRQVAIIVIAWMLTLPIAAALGLSIYYLLNYLSLRL
ncbi:MAG: inorganic phosphate transporter [Sulfolobales archaeon]